MQNNDHTGVLLVIKIALEGEHIPPCDGFGQSLKQEQCLCGVVIGCSRVFAILLDELYGRLDLFSLIFAAMQTCFSDSLIHCSLIH